MKIERSRLSDEKQSYSARTTEAACWAHARRKFYDIHVAGPTKITTHVLQVIGELYDIEATIRSKPPEERMQVRQEQSRPIVQRLHDWLTEQLPTLSRKSITADAIRYAMNQWQALTPVGRANSSTFGQVKFPHLTGA